MDISGFESRKRDHIRLALEEKNEALGGSGLERIHLAHRALPEMDLAEIRLGTQFFSHSAASPCFINSMTMGHREGEGLNQLLARIAGERSWPMGVGSQRRELVDSDAAREAEQLRKSAAKTIFFSNIGISQLISQSVDKVLAIGKSLEAAALIVHCNILQEALQPEGTPNFSGGLKALERLCAESPIPIILKETGCGFSREDFRSLGSIGLAAIDISGFGGTHWGRIEGGRSEAGSMKANAAKTFAFWGEPTVDSLLTSVAWKQESQSRVAIWASGGIRSGLDAAKCIALGADSVGFAKPALVAAQAGENSLRAWMDQMEFELKLALLCTASRTPEELRKGNKWRKI